MYRSANPTSPSRRRRTRLALAAAATAALSLGGAAPAGAITVQTDATVAIGNPEFRLAADASFDAGVSLAVGRTNGPGR